MYLSVFLTTPHKIDSNRKKWLEKNKQLALIMTLAALIISGYLFLKLNASQQIRIASVGLISLAYIIPSKRNIGLRWIPNFKIFIIAVCWTLLATLPIQASIIQNPTPYVAVWLFIIALTIPFDIRDLKSDPKTLRTIPQLIGLQASIGLSICCLSLALILLTISKFSISTCTANALFFIVATLLIRHLKKQTDAAYINIYIEGLPICWMAIAFIFTLLL